MTWANALRAACGWCCATGGAAALATGVLLAAAPAGTRAVALAAGGAALLAMIALPGAIARLFPARVTAPVATSLLLTMTAMSFATSQAMQDSATSTALPLVATGAALLAAMAWLARRADVARGATRHEVRLHDLDGRRSASALDTLRRNAPLVAPALLAGLSSGALARFQFFAICGTGPVASVQVALSLMAVLACGWLVERIDPRHALLALFALRGALLAALTLDALAPHAALAAPAFAVLDYLTLPTLMRLRPASRAARTGCPGGAHHAGMLAGAALATTPWCFGQGFYALFLSGCALNLGYAFAFAARRRAATHAPYPAPPALAARGAIDPA